MRPSTALHQHREAIYRAAARFRTTNPRYFGSTLRGEDSEGSDLDVIVDTLPGTTLFDLGGLQDELENLLGRCRHAPRPAGSLARHDPGRGPAGMTAQRLADYLDHMRQASADACEFVAGMDAVDP